MALFKFLLHRKSHRAIYREYEKLFDQAVMQHSLTFGTGMDNERLTSLSMQTASSQVMEKYGIPSDEMLEIISKGTSKWSRFRMLNPK